MSDEPNSRNETSRRPKDTLFHQQQMPYWNANYASRYIPGILTIIGGFFLIVGIYVQCNMFMLNEMVIDYTNCEAQSSPSYFGKTSDSKTCAEVIGNFSGHQTPDCTCKIPVWINMDFKGQKTYIYYALTNFYQNYRRLIKSRDDKQLNGIIENTPDSPSCVHYGRTEDDKMIWPCGAFANAMFQDTFKIKHKRTGKEIPLSFENVVWSTDKLKFKNPSNWNTGEFRKLVKPPPNWKRSPWELDPQNPENNGVENVDFIVWMRPEPSSNFRKLYRHIECGLEPGEYIIEIKYSYPAKDFGTKSIIFSTTSASLGGKNLLAGFLYFLAGIFYIICGRGLRYMTNENIDNMVTQRMTR